jgi:hypothetical protein
LTLGKAHYPELDLDLITFGILESGKDRAPVDKAAIQQSVLGYDQLCALGTQLNVYYEAYDLPGSSSQVSASVSTATAGADGGDDVSSAIPPSSYVIPCNVAGRNNASIWPLSGFVSLNF